MGESRRRELWYRDGLRFSCHRCHNCCRGAQPGFVYVGPFRIRRIAGFLGMRERSFRSKFVTRDENGEKTLKLQANGDCVFWQDGCTIYPERPRQCRTFPFWGENVASAEDWSKLKEFCHGVDSGRLYPLEEIRSVFHGQATRTDLT